MEKPEPMTYAQLKRHLDAMTPEQLAMPVQWTKDEDGGPVYGVLIMREDQCNPSGDGWEPKSDVIAHELQRGESQADAEAFAESEVVCRAGQMIIWTGDCVVADLEPNEPAAERAA